jgi:hypothetical protein
MAKDSHTVWHTIQMMTFDICIVELTLKNTLTLSQHQRHARTKVLYVK